MSIKVYVANIGKYNEGELVGAWFTLPMSPEEIEKKLHDEVLIGHSDFFGAPYEEYRIDDFEQTGELKMIGYEPNSYDLLEDVNILAAILEYKDVSVEELEKVWILRDQHAHYISPLGYANFIMQIDEIPCVDYSGYTGNSSVARFGRWYFDNDMNWNGKLGDIGSYVDFQHLGADKSNDFDLGINYALDLEANWPSEDWYSRDELRDFAEEVWC